MLNSNDDWVINGRKLEILHFPISAGDGLAAQFQRILTCQILLTPFFIWLCSCPGVNSYHITFRSSWNNFRKNGPSVKLFQLLHDDQNIICKKLTLGRYPVQQKSQTKKKGVIVASCSISSNLNDNLVESMRYICVQLERYVDWGIINCSGKKKRNMRKVLQMCSISENVFSRQGL